MEYVELAHAFLTMNMDSRQTASIERIVDQLGRAFARAVAAPARSARSEIAAALAEDEAGRAADEPPALYGLASVVDDEFVKDKFVGGEGADGEPVFDKFVIDKLDLGDVPALMPARRGHARAADDAEFGRRLAEVTPVLAGFDLGAHGLVLAGGGAADLLMRAPGDLLRLYHRKQIAHGRDLYLVGHATEESARAAIAALKDHLEAASAGAALVVYRAAARLVFAVACRKTGTAPVIQVVLRRFASAAHAVRDFDLGAQGVVWDGARVRVTALGRVAFAFGVNVLNLAARRRGYEHRLARYFDRGFGVALPALDGRALAAAGALPRLAPAGPAWVEVRAGLLFVCGGSLVAPGCPHDLEEAEELGYELNAESALAVASRNACALGREPVQTAELCAVAAPTTGIDIFAIQPTLEPGELARCVAVCCAAARAVAQPQRAALLLGRARAQQLADARSPAAARELAARLCAERCAELNPKAVIPFAIPNADKNPQPREAVPEAEWYGAAYAG